MNKYHRILRRIISTGKIQENTMKMLNGESVKFSLNVG
jgi:hypothetical protein